MPRVSHERWVSIGFLLPFRGMLGSSARTNPPALRVQDGARVAAVQGSEKAWLERSWCRACRGRGLARSLECGRGGHLPLESYHRKVFKDLP